MRFLCYDRILALEKGCSMTGLKSFSLTDESLRGHYTKRALIPGVLLIESMAQLLGWLIIYSHDFQISTFMSLIEDVEVPSALRPGVTLRVEAELVATSSRDSLGKVQMYHDGERVASLGRIIYGHFQRADREQLVSLFRYYTGLTGAGPWPERLS